MTADDLSDLGYANLAAIEEAYLQFQDNPSTVDPSWRQFFERYDDDIDREVVNLALDAEAERPIAQRAVGDLRITDLVNAYRTYGHLHASFNPIRTHELQEPYELKLSTLGFSNDDLDQSFPTMGLLDKPHAPLRELIAVLREIYCGTVGVEYMGLQMPEMERWLQQHIEPSRFKVDLSLDERKQVLEQLNRSEIFESFLHTKYSGQKRFSLEGGETVIPILNAVIEQGANLGMRQFVLGMAHRGRLNVLCNTLNKSYQEIFSEFEEGYIPDSFEGSGDVKYHKGFESDTTTANGHDVHIRLMPNPSHLEAVNSVVSGQARALQVQSQSGDGKDEIVPILIHGDAAIAGQGIIYEVMQMYRLPGYDNGGTIHIVINNQIGFTTLPKDARSTRYCTDIARTFTSPVFHVNVEDPEGCVYATKLAIELRHRFHCDVFIDLNCYRKYGHNEGDEPAFTQPLEYQLIRKKRPVREIYRDALVDQGVLEKPFAEELEKNFRDSLQEIKAAIDAGDAQKPLRDTSQPKYEPLVPVDTSVPAEVLRQTAERFCHVPENFNIHRKLKRLLSDRMEMVAEKDAKPIDWGMAEHLALASLLWEGHHVRISGQDTRRGTFSHRHAMWMDQVQERKYFPLNWLKEEQGRFDVFNSLLSEYGALGFEYGYSMANPEALVVWEAQFGDFCNGAQIIIDQFISTGEQKWGLRLPLVMLLPHGYEGQGPEHSSARIERFLSLCGHHNMQVVNPTTPAQLFHLLRRQVLMPVKKPLVVFTPKGLLRYPHCVSTMEDLTTGSFKHLIDDPRDLHAAAKRVIFCSGRIYYDLIEECEQRGDTSTAVVRLEQFYPLHKPLMREIINKYPKAKTWLWVQEEPGNMGGWKFVRRRLREALPKGHDLEYVGRERSASPSAGSFALHKREHGVIMEKIFGKNNECHNPTNRVCE